MITITLQKKINKNPVFCIRIKWDQEEKKSISELKIYLSIFFSYKDKKTNDWRNSLMRFDFFVSLLMGVVGLMVMGDKQGEKVKYRDR